jgi:hypothetical protein
MKEKPIFLRVHVSVARRGADDGKLFRLKNALTKGVFAITLSKRAMFFNCKTNKKTKGIPIKHRSTTVAL